ncbi:MAG: hypothetical protein LH649_07980 [Pseudanabaena sp. CAN_BIN31]|nr:hypothetical protein [Pseudanabaena sp. CAN_BIN31]
MSLKIFLQQHERIKEARKRIKEDYFNRTLDLSELGLEWIPDEISELSDLMELFLNSNQLTVIPEEICNLFNLQGLYLDFNQLRDVRENKVPIT